jgi:hypothetical protein
MKLVKFQDIHGKETFINPDRLNFIADYGSGTSELNFGGEESTVYVAMEVSAVAKTLLKGTTEK